MYQDTQCSVKCSFNLCSQAHYAKFWLGWGERECWWCLFYKSHVHSRVLASCSVWMGHCSWTFSVVLFGLVWESMGAASGHGGSLPQRDSKAKIYHHILGSLDSTKLWWDGRTPQSRFEIAGRCCSSAVYSQSMWWLNCHISHKS